MASLPRKLLWLFGCFYGHSGTLVINSPDHHALAPCTYIDGGYMLKRTRQSARSGFKIGVCLRPANPWSKKGSKISICSPRLRYISLINADSTRILTLTILKTYSNTDCWSHAPSNPGLKNRKRILVPYHVRTSPSSSSTS